MFHQETVIVRNACRRQALRTRYGEAGSMAAERQYPVCGALDYGNLGLFIASHAK